MQTTQCYIGNVSIADIDTNTLVFIMKNNERKCIELKKETEEIHNEICRRDDLV
jgi:hypothetical protein